MYDSITFSVLISIGLEMAIFTLKYNNYKALNFGIVIGFLYKM